MRMMAKGNISRKLAICFLLIAFVFLIFGSYILYDVRTISDYTRTIFNHPLVVSNAAQEASVSIVKMHRAMKDVVLFNEPQRIQHSIDTVSFEEQKAYQALDLVSLRILGTRGQKLVNDTRTLFAAWKPIREKVINLVRMGHEKKAAEITIGAGAAHVVRLEQRMDALAQYARAKASVFMREAESTQTRLQVTAIAAMVLCVSIFALITFVTLKATAAAENELRESRQLLVKAFDDAPIGMVLVAPTGRFFRINQAYCALTGYSAQELSGMSFQDVLLPDDPDRTPDSLEKFFRDDDGRAPFESRYVTREGVIIEVLMTTSVLKDGQADPLYLFVQAQDITDRKKAEQALRRSENQFRAVTDNSPIATLVTLGVQEKILTVNRRFTELFGYTRADLPDVSAWWPLAYPNSDARERIRQQWTKNIEAAIKHQARLGPSEVTVSCRDRTTRRVRIETVSVAETNIITFVDLTEIKAVQASLKESEQKYRSMMESFADPLYICSPDLTIAYMNPAMRRRIGRDATGEPCYSALHGLDQRCAWCIFEPESDRLPVEINVTSPLDNRTYRVTNMPIHNQDGTISKMTIFRDITEYLEALAEKKAALSHLLQVQRMETVGNLAGGIAHDFNNLLSSIIGFTELALEEAERGTLMEDNLQEVYTAGKRARDLVKQILAFSRQSDDQRQPIRVDTIAKEILQLIRSTIPATIDIRSRIKSEERIMGNSVEVHQLFMNLCTNATQAMEAKGGILEFVLEDFTQDDILSREPAGLEPGCYVKISVADNGTGIAPDVIGSVFEPYFTTKAVGKGTGMGLALAHGIVESYDGQMTVESEIGHGTVFAVYLPVSSEQEAYQPFTQDVLPVGTERILFVDDEWSVVKASSQILEGLGYTVTTRTSSVEALELFRSRADDFDLVITDMTMPNMTGDALAEELIALRHDIPVILCTGYSLNLTDERVAQIGIRDLVYKPIVKADLAHIVRQVLDAAGLPA